MQLKHPWPLRLPASTRHFGCVPASAAILRPMAAMAVSQPSARPQDGCHTAVAAIWPDGRRMAVANSIDRPSLLAAPDTSAGGSTRSASHHTLVMDGWRRYLLAMRWHAWSGYCSSAILPADGCDLGCSRFASRTPSVFLSFFMRAPSLLIVQTQWSLASGPSLQSHTRTRRAAPRARPLR